MARGKYNKVVCDVCGFGYSRSVMTKNSYGLWVCPQDNDRSYDLLNHPQNRQPRTEDRSIFIKDARPEANNDRNQSWEALESFWEDITTNWNQL